MQQRNTPELAVGKWFGILPIFGVGSEFLTGKHHSCPMCNAGKDRFRFANTEGKGEWFCSQCGNGDGFDLIGKINNWDFKKSAQEVEKIVTNVKRVATPTRKTPDQIRASLNNIRKRVHPVTSQISKYLNSRGIDNSTIYKLKNDVGGVNGLEYWKSGSISSRHTAMVCKVKKLGKPISYHVTYLDNGKKASVSCPRKLLTPTEKATGAVIELFEHDDVLGVAEGVETAMSAYQLFGIPTWSTINANNMEQFVVPAGVKKLYIFGDNDAGTMTGQRAAEILKQKAEYQGIEVIKQIPVDSGQDWNDCLIEENRAKLAKVRAD